MENIHYDVGMNHVGAILNPIINYATAEIKKPDQVFNYEFQNILTNLLRIMTEKNKVYTEAVNRIEAVKELIDKELGPSNS